MTADGSALDTGILLLRLVLGLTMAAHGLKKLFGSGRIAGTAAWFESIGMRPALPNAIAAATTETVGGVALAIGLLTPVAAAAFVALMLVAVWTVHRHNGFFATSQGWEYNLVLAGSSLAVAAIGAGQFSADYALFDGQQLEDLMHGWSALLFALAAGLAAGTAQLLMFYRPAATTVRSQTA